MQTEINNIQKEVNKLSRKLDGVKNDLSTRHKTRAKKKLTGIELDFYRLSNDAFEIICDMEDEELDGRSN